MQPNKSEGRHAASPALSRDLLNALHAAIAAGETSRPELCQAMGVTPSYLNLLMSGARSWSGLRLSAVRALAVALNRPPMWVMVRTGRVDLADFFTCPAATTTAAIYDQMVAAPTLAAYVPDRATWESLPSILQQQFVLMFQAASTAQQSSTQAQ